MGKCWPAAKASFVKCIKKKHGIEKIQMFVLLLLIYE